MQEDRSTSEFVRQSCPRAWESLSSLETLVDVNPEMLRAALEFAVILGVRAGMLALAKEKSAERVEELVRKFDWRGSRW